MVCEQPDDQRFMAAAIRLGRSHLGQTLTNPSVGCVIVADGTIVGSAVTAIGGRPHAERQALAVAGEKARGATAYVTLEPCSHHGKTPPCADALVEAGVARVVVAVTDPDPRVSGRGLSILTDAGIEVVTGVLEREARYGLAAYLTRQTKQRPHVTLKLALSRDGMIGRAGGGQVAITGSLARTQVQLLRAESDAILVGIGTAKADDPDLTVRLAGQTHLSPLRIVLDRRLELPIGSKLVQTAGHVPTVCACGEPSTFTCTESFEASRTALQAAGVDVWPVADLDDLLRQLAVQGMSSLLVEGGAAAAKAFLNAGLVDRIHLYQGPDEIGGSGLASPLTPANIPENFRHLRSVTFGADRFDEYEQDF
ncbi:bifunctional diaminohydroxyphosphoribosylaminopyrimidine deaminase/5-amino-6-(5-phosphoribosylamino)uracil reductase RibD [Agrobacterium vitis]|uniref:bifunctional diaminohydroxyphosphoribosylaminopyrimidine deaminase/5-amino-6-(5-phosphoribosylamino)uracil reductase RibD n=1 Tax=Agrobacterium vitis TaxID=373 RepID=UPI001573BC25|nr:bifunctional diaminohydroxyphosphoribosylaminopyrimidine deaminase/5-amino-6-(5-phosphoribosylamino)uracil reductase RibD [Agrobacterium vitis]NSZ16319.1 bifunctional diaminohydroxyphosphoribosylaminopyrimidine deaminase/5-amino-6-(5-phosphoribosylamino)uracil reductase RibD [Agrobacterium vitis]QZO05076.1 bifunctional diaminohydroxyphosphoribosylaminopyrimidine deaminase/5-amino-6-(5-phosphoribosylamino)uracil reductase RibD [Agrobacterium vitis]UJL87224.1 bifunctional diaminohydroxyphosphor